MRVTNTFNANMVEQRMKAAIGLLAATSAQAMETEAKSSARWTDRTSHARNSIQGRFGWEGDKAKITLSGNMDYSVYLELAHEKRFAILVPTIQRNAPTVLSAYQRLVR